VAKDKETQDWMKAYVFNPTTTTFATTAVPSTVTPNFTFTSNNVSTAYNAKDLNTMMNTKM
jgi:hypothetical protein